MNHQQLESIVHQEIPITQALGIRINQLTDTAITVSAPFSANKNIHNTAFAGSIYTVATIAGWSLVNNLASINGIEGSVVLAKAEMQYKKPINGDIIATCQLKDTTALATFLNSFQRKNRARITVTIELIEDSETKATLTANFALVGKPST